VAASPSVRHSPIEAMPFNVLTFILVTLNISYFTLLLISELVLDKCLKNRHNRLSMGFQGAKLLNIEG
jgi:hypothetical protein